MTDNSTVMYCTETFYAHLHVLQQYLVEKGGVTRFQRAEIYVLFQGRRLVPELLETSVDMVGTVKLRRDCRRELGKWGFLNKEHW